MSVLEDLGIFLQTAGLGTLATDLFRGGLPMDTPTAPVHDAIMVLIPVPGLPAVFALSGDGAPCKVEQPVIQVLCRGNPHDFLGAFTRAMAAYNALDGLNNTLINNVFYLMVMAMQPPFCLRQADEMGRPHIAFNIRCAKH